MASGQKDIYYLVSEREEDARRSPQLEAARKHGCDVLLFCDPVDEYLTESLREFDVKKQEHALPPSMVRMMRAMKQDVPEEKRILEVNPNHPLVAKVKGLEGDALKDAVTLLYDSALIAEGSPAPDGAKFAKLLADLMMK